MELSGHHRTEYRKCKKKAEDPQGSKGPGEKEHLGRGDDLFHRWEGTGKSEDPLWGKCRKSHISGLPEKSCHETVDKKYFGQFYNFLTKDSNPMYNKIQMGIEGNKKQKEGTI